MKSAPIDAGATAPNAHMLGAKHGAELTITCHVIIADDLRTGEANFEGGAPVELLAIPRVGEWVSGFGKVTDIIHHPRDGLDDTPMVQIYVRREQANANRT